MFRLVVLLSLLGCLSFASAGDVEDAWILADANTEFALDMYKEIGQENSNIIFSPYSLSTALAMAATGAQGNTFTEMYKALKYDSLGESAVLDLSKKLIMILSSETNKYNMSVANKLYGEKTFTIKQLFLTQLRDSFDTTLEKTDFRNAPETARKTINNWVESVTDNKIKDLLAENTVTSKDVLYIVNAIYFGAIWRYQFDKRYNQDGQDFYVSSDKTEKVTYMVYDGIVPDHGYANLPELGAEMLELPYNDDNKVSMYIILPKVKSNNALSDMESRLNADHFKNSNRDNIFSKVNGYIRVNVKIPKFEMKLPMFPKEILSKMGMKQAFTSGADFSRIANGPVAISDVVHQAFINVHEAGTEAAAATAIRFFPLSMPFPYQRVNFFADHPFIYLIREKTTGTILFMGRYVEPPAGGGSSQQIMDQTAYSSPWHWFYSKLGIPV